MKGPGGLVREQQFRAMTELLSSKYGFFSNVRLTPSRQPEHRHFIATVVDDNFGEGKSRHLASGIAPTREGALAAAIGEAMERTFARDLGQCQILRDESARNLQARGLKTCDIQQCNFFSEIQYGANGFGIRKFDQDSRLDWIAAWSPRDRESVWIPAFLGIFAYAEGCLIGSSNGLACGNSLAQAAVTAILELIERDAFMYSWWTKSPVRRVDVQSLVTDTGEWGEQLARDFGKNWLAQVTLGVSTMDHGIPVFIARIKGRDLGASCGVGFGAAARLNPREGARKALAELLIGCEKFFSPRLQNAQAREFGTDFNETIKDFDDHIDFYLQKLHEDDADFIFATETETEQFSSLANLEREDDKANLSEILARLARCDVVPFFIDLTPPTLNAAGFRVVRACAPELLRIDAEHRYRHWGQKRLFTLGQRLGPSANQLIAQLDEHGLNRLPHAFP